MSAPSATCTQHAQREAVGICVRCQAPLCSDCITKIDGINHCRACLTALASGQATPAPSRHVRLPGWLALGVGASLLSLLSWLMLEALLPGGGGP